MGEWIPRGRARVTHLCQWRTAELPRNGGRQWAHCRQPSCTFHVVSVVDRGCLHPPQCCRSAPCWQRPLCKTDMRQRCVLFGTSRRCCLLLLLLLLLRLLPILLHQGPNIIFMQIAVAVATTPKRRSLPRRLPVDGR